MTDEEKASLREKMMKRFGGGRPGGGGKPGGSKRK
jgi:hypothetical protein